MTETSANADPVPAKDAADPDYDSGVITFVARDTNFVYNMPDAYETNPEVVRSELLFFSTPFTQEYSEKVYDSIKNIHDQCEADFSAFCAKVDYGPFFLMDFDQFMNQMLSPSVQVELYRRKLSIQHALHRNDGLQFLKSLRTFYMDPIFTQGGKFLSQHSKPLKKLTSYLKNKQVKEEQEKVPTSSKFSPPPWDAPSKPAPPKDVLSGENAALVETGDVNKAEVRNHHIIHTRKAMRVLRGDTPMHGEHRDHENNGVDPRHDHPHGDHKDFGPHGSRDTASEGESVPPPRDGDRPRGPYGPDGSGDAALTKGESVPPPRDGGRPRGPYGPDGSGDAAPEERSELPPPRDGGRPRGPPGVPPNHENAPRGPPADIPPGLPSDNLDQDWIDEDSDSEVEEGDEEEFGGDRHGHHHHGHRHYVDNHYHEPIEQDNSFAGALGYGAEGDLCMYQNLNQLSEPCTSAITDLYALRQNYWTEQQMMVRGPPPHHGHIFLVLLALFALYAFFRRRMFWRKRREVRSFVEAIRSNPKLKEIVEAETGLKVPEFRCPYHAHGNDNARGSFCCRLIRGLAFFGLICVSSFLITISSLEITGAIIMSINQSYASHNTVDAETGEVKQVGVGFALLLLVIICTVEIGLFVFLVRGIRKLYMRTFHANNHASPSAPMEVITTNASSNDGNSGTVIVQTASSAAAPRRMVGSWNLGSFPQALFSVRRSNPEGYTPLSTEEEEGGSSASIPVATTNTSTSGYVTEMVSVVPSAWRATHVQPQVHSNTPQQQQYAIVPITASPISNVNFV